jgi:hypothetical protein
VNRLINNDQGIYGQNIDIAGVAKYAVNDYGASWATSATIAADLLTLFPDPIKGDIAVLRNTNGTDSSRFYFYTAAGWETFDSTTIADGAVTLAKLAAGVLSADAAGRAKMANGFVLAAQLGSDAVETVKIKNANVTTPKLSTAAATRVLDVLVPALAAGADISLTATTVPTGCVFNAQAASITPAGTATGVDDSNTSVWAITDGTNTLVTKTFDADPAFPDAGTNTDLGALDASYDNVAAGAPIKINVTNGTTAATPATMVHIPYTLTDA